MGEIIEAGKLQVDDIFKYNCPIIVVKDSNRIRKVIQNTFEKINLNLNLANRLLGYEKALRAMKSEEEAKQIVRTEDKPLYIEDYEMLFTPDYEIDVLRYLCEMARTRHIAIKWCGELNGKILSYSEPGNEDYKCYDINDYDVLCIK